ncbi:CAP domain-containing protein [Clostridium sp.]|uniref:CAP domain-containing protein n=1 Tax=Clostridium sp. TaxID=1506 RepID=UPI00260855F2|nr:CAP domain-containing protein [Clostridium sp.]
MIKSRIISLLLSGCLTAGLGVGNYFLKPNINKIPNNKEVFESNESTSNGDSNNSIDNNSNSNTSTETKPNESNNGGTSGNVNNGTSTETPKENKDDLSGIVNDKNPGETGNENTNTQNPNTDNSQATPEEKPQAESSDKYIAEIEQAIFQRVNQERATAGLPALTYNTTMEHYARFKSQDMGDRKYFDHTNPEGKLITEKMKADGVSYRAWGENIAYISGISGNAQLSTQFMDNWMNSQGHRANILSSNFSSIGVGVYKIGNTYYATQEFYK